jgi:hypothetical protein
MRADSSAIGWLWSTMTPDEILRQATRDLRSRIGGVIDDPERTRERVLALTARRRRRRAHYAGAATLALLLAMVSTGWAAATGRLPNLIRSVDRFLRPRAETPKTAPRPSAPLVVENFPSPEAPSSPAQTTPGPPRRLALSRPPPANTRSQAPSDPHLQERLFRAANQAQFVARNPQSALDRWDAYLRLAPEGRYALEANYNRAICLVRLGKHAEAIVELAPFADGVHGSYRQREARRLIDAMEAEAGQ